MAVAFYFHVQVGAGGDAGVADDAEYAFSGNAIACVDESFCGVTVLGLEAV